MKRHVIPQHLHQPLQILWFDTHEIYLLVGLYITVILLGGFTWIVCAVAPFILIPDKRKANRGAVRHLLYWIGLHNFCGYPDASAKAFHH
jgi:predicted membrane-bound mannosyltransferase